MFDPCLMATGFGALWCTDWEYPVLVRVTERDRTPQVWASWPAADGPQGLAAGLDAIWVLPGEGDQVLEIDPGRGGVTAHRVPFPLAGIAVGPDAVFGIGQLGDGRVLRLTPGGAATSAPAGQARTLDLIAASAGYVWVVDDETATVLALDAGSLEPVQSFGHVGAPRALFARGRQAWYVCGREVAYQDEGGRQGRAALLGPGWPTMDLLRLDAAAGTAERLRDLPGLASAATLIDNRLWVSGEQQEGAAEDPVTSLCCLDLDGRDITAIELPGQIDAIGASDSLVWAAGFRRSRQENLVTVLNADAAVTGEVSFRGVDLTRWAPPPPAPAARLPLGERAQAIRDAAAACLSEPVQAGNRFGDRWEAPAISPEFQLERVDLRGSGDSYEIAVLFRWAGETDLFGMRFDISPDDEDYLAPDAYISVYVEENLLAGGYGVANATREHADGITWLRWPRA
jgi:hypothetical protein